MLTALGEERDRIAGLEVGADDYVTKPFSPRELVLRVQSVLRRRSVARRAPSEAEAPLVDGDLEIDTVGHHVRLRGEAVALTGREYDLLCFFLRHPGRAFSRAELLSEVWGWSFGDHSTVTVHVRRLREKLEDDPAAPHAHHDGVGRGLPVRATGRTVIAAHDAGEIMLVVGGAAAGAAVVGAGALRLLRKRSVLASLVVVAVTASVVVAAGTAVIGQMMLVSGHAFRVLMLVLVVSLVAGLAVAWLLGRSLTAGSHVLAGALREIGDDDFVSAADAGDRRAQRAQR